MTLTLTREEHIWIWVKAGTSTITKTSELTNDGENDGNSTDRFAKISELGGVGGMTKVVYDTNDNGIVDNAEQVNGLTVETAVPSSALFTDTIMVLEDLLTSTSTTTGLTSNQGRVLKGLIDNIVTLLASDDTTLDELQEIVDFIKQNKTTLDTLGISNIAGLANALNAKAPLALVTTNFDKALSGADTSAQLAFETLDEVVGDIEVALIAINGV